MKRYLNTDTGEVFTLEELTTIWNQFGYESKHDTFEDMVASLEEVEYPAIQGIITVDDFKKVVEEFGFNHPVTTAVWNTMENNERNAEEFETVYAMWATGKFN